MRWGCSYYHLNGSWSGDETLVGSIHRKQIWIVYPFTAGTLGTGDDYFLSSNQTNAFFVALRRIGREMDLEISAVYLTDLRRSYEETQDEIRFRFMPTTLGRNGDVNSFGRQWSRTLVSRLAKEKPALVFLFIGGGWFAVTLALVCKTLGISYCPIIAGRGIATRRSLRWYYKNALRTIVHTDGHKSQFTRAGVDTRNFLVMPMGVDTDLFRPKPAEFYARRNGDARFIHVGRIVPGKNLQAAVRVLSRVRAEYPNATLDVVGPTSDPTYWRETQQMISALGLESQVRFRGVLDNRSLASLYAQADMMLFPSLSESFGFVIAESMACGTPVAALRGCGGPDEIIEDGADGILADEETLADRVLAVLSSSGNLQSMSQAARDKIEQRYGALRTYHQARELVEAA